MLAIINKIYNNSTRIINVPSFKSLVCTNALLGLSFAFIYPFLSLFGTNEVGMSSTKLGYFMTITSLSGIIISTILGKLSDSVISRKWIIIISSFSAFIGYLLFAYIRDYYSLILISVILLGISSSAYPQLFAYARENIEKTNSDVAPLFINTLRMFFSATWVIGPVVGGIILIQFGFQGLYILISLIFLAIAVIAIFYLKNDMNRTSEISNENKQKSSNVLTTHIMANFCAFTLLESAGMISLINMPLFVVKTLNGTTSDVGILFGFAALLEIPFMIWFGILAIRYNKSKIIMIGIVVNIVYFILIMFVIEPWHIIPIQILSAISVAILMGIGISYFQDLIPKELGMATTLFSNASRIGSLMGGIISGFAAEFFGYRLVFFSCATMCFVALLLILIFRKKEFKKDGMN
jgi:SET family sugar efflux transporter-like MFS transporter